ncbi:MAG: cryptochrome/photolyase family protein [Planctomycetales bacterium]|nr:cryptochrome/photolyase family protein [Planctomycetales bacterium]
MHQKYGALEDAHKTQDLIVLIESQSMRAGAEWHPERLFFLLSSARHFVQTLKENGFSVLYEKAENTAAGLQEIQKQHPGIPLICAARHFRMAGRDQRSMDRYRESIITKRRKKCLMMAGERDRACSVEFAADSVCPAITGMGAVPQ